MEDDGWTPDIRYIARQTAIKRRESGRYLLPGALDRICDGIPDDPIWWTDHNMIDLLTDRFDFEYQKFDQLTKAHL